MMVFALSPIIQLVRLRGYFHHPACAATPGRGQESQVDRTRSYPTSLSLAKEKRLQAPGLLQVSAAKADGRWARAYASPSAAQVPADFLEALAKDPQALAFFKTLNKSNTYAICYRLSTDERP